MNGPVEPELLLDHFDQFGVETLGAGKLALGGGGLHGLGSGVGPRNATRRAGILARQRRDHLIDRPARRKLDDEEIDGDDPNEGREDQQDPAGDIPTHVVRAPSTSPPGNRHTIPDYEAHRPCKNAQRTTPAGRSGTRLP